MTSGVCPTRLAGSLENPGLHLKTLVSDSAQPRVQHVARQFSAFQLGSNVDDFILVFVYERVGLFSFWLSIGSASDRQPRAEHSHWCYVRQVEFPQEKKAVERRGILHLWISSWLNRHLFGFFSYFTSYLGLASASNPMKCVLYLYMLRMLCTYRVVYCAE